MYIIWRNFMYRKLFTIGLSVFMVVFVMNFAQVADAQDKITGPWLWVMAPAPECGAAGTDVDSLAAASSDAVTEAMVASDGANEGDAVGDFQWTLGEIAATGGNNINDTLVAIGFAEGDINNHTSYALITLEAAAAQNDVTMRVGSDDSIKVWLNGEEVHRNAVNRGAGDYQDTFNVNLVEGDNLLLVKVGECGGGWSMFVGIDADVNAVYKAPPPPIVHIEGQYLWMIAPTEAGQGGANSTDIDSLAVASEDDDNQVTEEWVATNGAREGDVIGDYEWVLAELPADGNINTMLVEAGVTENGDINDISSYAVITLVSAEDVEGAMMGVSSDDSVKVWLNGEVVHTNATNRGRGGAGSFQDTFSVNLKKGDNLLVIKVSERGGGWGMFAGINADVEAMYKPGKQIGTAVEAADKLVTTWGKVKGAK